MMRKTRGWLCAVFVAGFYVPALSGRSGARLLGVLGVSEYPGLKDDWRWQDGTVTEVEGRASRPSSRAATPGSPSIKINDLQIYI
jgi:hypothetical protein